MKKGLLILTMLLVTATIIAQESSLPEKIRITHTNKFPTARGLDWYFENNRYVLEFEMRADAYAAVYDSEGNWVETAIVVSDMDIPGAVTSAINQQCPKNKLSYGEKVENAKKENFYRVHCYNDEADFIVNVTESGKVLSYEKIDKPVEPEVVPELL